MGEEEQNHQNFKDWNDEPSFSDGSYLEIDVSPTKLEPEPAEEKTKHAEEKDKPIMKPENKEQAKKKKRKKRKMKTIKGGLFTGVSIAVGMAAPPVGAAMF